MFLILILTIDTDTLPDTGTYNTYGLNILITDRYHNSWYMPLHWFQIWYHNSWID